jgi:ElaA protein
LLDPPIYAFRQTVTMTNLRWRWARFDDLGVHDLYDALALRCRVFILEQAPYQDPDGIDPSAWHLLGRSGESGELVAYLRVVDPGAKYPQPSIGRVIAARAWRGTGVGRLLMSEGIARCEAAWPGQAICISAQAHLQRFYGSLGFEAVSDPYLEDGIPHIEMLRPAPLVVSSPGAPPEPASRSPHR